MSRSFIVIAVLLLFASVVSAAAQTRVETREFDLAGSKRVSLNLKYGETITVKTWDRNRMSFRAEVKINGGRLNDALILRYNQEEGIHVSADYDTEKLENGRMWDCPRRSGDTVSWFNSSSGNVVCSTIFYEIRVPANTALTVESVSADIELVGLFGPLNAKSISGYVDLTWPEGKDADLSLKTIMGEAYTDLENLTFTNRKRHPGPAGYRLNGTIGNGGIYVHLESVSGDIFLRSGR